jgi:hypothetical protein
LRGNRVALSLYALVSGLVMASSATCRADDAEDKAVAFVEKLGGSVFRDSTWPDKPVIDVNLDSTKVTDADLKELANLKKLTSLSLWGTNVTEEHLKNLQKLMPKSTLISR